MRLTFSIETGVDIEIARTEFGDVADFDAFREAVVAHVENGVRGSRCPVLQSFVPEGCWTPEDCVALRGELALVQRASLSPALRDLFATFVDEDGEPIIERLDALCVAANKYQRPISRDASSPRPSS